MTEVMASSTMVAKWTHNILLKSRVVKKPIFPQDEVIGFGLKELDFFQCVVRYNPLPVFQLVYPKLLHGGKFLRKTTLKGRFIIIENMQ